MNITDFYNKENTQENRDILSKLINQEVLEFSCINNVLTIETKVYLEPSVCEIKVPVILRERLDQ